MLDCSSVTVGICTHRRDYVVTALESVMAQEKVEPNFRVIVVDNDERDTARAILQPFMDKYGDRVRYVHAPARNISIARNAVLDNVETRWLAFLDDDEYASYDWLFTLASNRGKADIVLGPVKAVYSDEAPSWAVKCDFHSTLAKQDIWNAFTGNVMLDMDMVNRSAARFDLRLGKTGGEDTFFFRHLKDKGATIAYAENAVVYEEVMPSRATVSWLVQRKFRSGQTHWDLSLAFSEADKLTLASSAAVKSAFSIAMAGATAYSRPKSIFWLARAAFHAGVVSKLFGSETREEYSVVPSRLGTRPSNNFQKRPAI